MNESTYVRLPLEFKAELLSALRSGEYKQGKNLLVCEGEYCILGLSGHLLGYSDEELIGYGSLNVLEKDLGKGIEIPEALKGTIGDILITMNDKGYTFEEIATFIERVL